MPNWKRPSTPCHPGTRGDPKQRDDHASLAALGIDTQEDLFLLMAQAHLSIPRLPEALTQGMADGLQALAS